MKLTQALQSVPIDLGTDQARRLIEEELAKPQYHSGDSLLTRAWRWLIEYLQNLKMPSGGVAWQAILIVVVIIGLIALAAFIISGPVRRSAQAKSRDIFAPDDVRTATEVRDQAEQWAALGRWREAGIERFRALALALAERELIQLADGLTAQEVGRQAGRRLPSLAAALVEASVDFDRLAYGHHVGDAATYQRLRNLDEVVAATTARPASNTNPAVVVTL